jgi:hypothetical protein
MSYDIQQLRRPRIFDIGQDIDPNSSTMMLPTYDDEEMYIPDQQDSRFISPVSQQTQNQPSANQNVNDPRNPNRIMEQINQIYTPETRSRDRVNNLLDNVPEREEPTWGRRLVAGGMGLGSKDPIKTMEDVMYAPHARAMTDWSAKTGPFQQAYSAENTANINERTLAGNAVTAQVNQERYDQQNRVAEDRNDIARIRANAQTAKANKWDVKVVGTEVWAYPPDASKESPRLLGRVKGKMDEADKIDLEGKWDVKAAEARGATSEAAGAYFVQGSDGTLHRVNPRADVTGAENLPPGNYNRVGTPSRASTATETPTNIERARQNRLRKIYDNNAEFQKFFTTTAGKLELVPKPKSESQVADWERARRLAYPPKDTNLPIEGSVYNPGTEPTPKASTPKAPQEAAPTARVGAGETEMIDIQTGKHFAVRSENVAKAVATGRYKQVQ